jgi:hypothetical protein
LYCSFIAAQAKRHREQNAAWRSVLSVSACHSCMATSISLLKWSLLLCIWWFKCYMKIPFATHSTTSSSSPLPTMEWASHDCNIKFRQPTALQKRNVTIRACPQDTRRALVACDQGDHIYLLENAGVLSRLPSSRMTNGMADCADRCRLSTRPHDDHYTSAQT